MIIENGVVARITDKALSPSPGMDFRGYYIAPGFIDTHTHGCCGIDITNIKSPSQLNELSKALLKFGVTAFVPTLVSASHERILQVLQMLVGVKDKVEGARVLGMALEGPYINPRRKGAQDPNAIRPANIEEFHQYVNASKGGLILMHMAPEIEGGLDLIQEAVRQGVHVSIGHTEADYETAMKAIALGANRATHLYDAMSGIHHREAGAAAALLQSEDVYLELITDFIHVRREMVRFTIDYAGPSRVVLITDSIAAAGLGDGEYILGGVKVIVKGGRATLEDGVTLAGSVLTLNQAVRNVISLGIEPRLAIAMATLIPAKSLGYDSIGCLRPGCKADFVVLSKDRYEVVRTILTK